MNKCEVVHNLKNVKLVLGNGFDLYCGLKTKYSDYFDSYEEKYGVINNWRNDFYYVGTYLKRGIANADDFWKELDQFGKINVWDLLFCFLSIGSSEVKNWKWCDIESEIAESLQNKTGNSKLTWDKVYELLVGTYINSNKYEHDVLLMAAFLKRRYGVEAFSSERTFFKILLDELKMFERIFGIYINGLIHPSKEENYGVRETAILHSNKSKRTIEKLCNLDNLSSIDTFNYDTPEIDEIEDMVNNVNGDVSNPIFGVDTDVFKAEDARFIFTKTSRRMELDMIKREDASDKEFENVIIFGHSLSEADFNYFFSIFDRIEITNLVNRSKVVFAYSVYDQNKKEEIMSDIRRGITYMFQEYSKYKNGQNNGNRLLDQLTTQRKVVMYDIDTAN